MKTFRKFMQEHPHPCRYDKKPCYGELLCSVCERQDLTNLPHSNDPIKPIIWEDDFGEGGTGYPKCPECHELAYGMMNPDENSVGQCPFCGQHYEYDAEDKEKAEPSPEETIICMRCHQRTMVGRRAKVNGHFHGKCTNCGCITIA